MDSACASESEDDGANNTHMSAVLAERNAGGAAGASPHGFHMPLPAQAVAIVSAPVYPNAVKWSDENLVAVASGHLAYILNPASLAGPRCFVPVPKSPAFNIGRIQSSDMLAPSLLALALAKDTRPCVRSLCWSPQGYASNGGCLLAVCTTDHRVKFYRSPYCEFQSEWVEVLDVSAMIYAHLAQNNFADTESKALILALEDNAFAPPNQATMTKKRKTSAASVLSSPRRTRQKTKREREAGTADSANEAQEEDETVPRPNEDQISEGSTLEVLRVEEGVRSWSPGLVLKVVGSKLLVKYGGSSADSVEEWFNRYSSLPSGEDTAPPPIRPQGPTERLPMVGAQQKELNWCVTATGQIVEVWRNDRWLEALLVDASCSPMKVSIPGDPGVISVEQHMLRRAPHWNGREWVWSQSVELWSHSKQCTGNHQQINQKDPQSSRNGTETSRDSFITAAQYAARNNELAHLVVAWSPPCGASVGRDVKAERVKRFSIFATGGKSGRIFFFRVSSPVSYSIDKALPLVGTDCLGSVAAHDSWVTALEWALSPIERQDAATCSMLLASGSSDGSVKLWVSDTQKLGDFCPSANTCPIQLLTQVVAVELVPITCLALTSTTSQDGGRVLLAIGKGSGSVAALECNMSGEYDGRACNLCAHDQLVTGLTWTFDGRTLFSCGQDDSLRMWEFSGSKLQPLAFPSGSSLLTSDPTRTSNELPAAVLESFFGVALSPGNLALVVARSISADMVDQMYQARSQKGIVQLFWIGGHHTQGNHTSSTENAAVGLSAQDLRCWESRIVTALHHLEHRQESLVFWDVIAATSLIKEVACSFQPVESILSSWLSNQPLGCSIDVNTISQFSSERMEQHVSGLSCRRLQMMNGIYRKVLLSRFRAEVLSGRNTKRVLDIHGKDNAEEDAGGTSAEVSQEELWRDHLIKIEQELRYRLMLVTLSAATCERLDFEEDAQSGDDWTPSGTLLMADWVLAKDMKTFPELVHAATRAQNPDAVVSLSRSVRSPSVSRDSEMCNICTAPVPFDSLEVAYCQNEESTGRGRNHKLQRCSVSLQICRAVPQWFCRGCSRWAVNLPPLLFFAMSSRMHLDRIPLPLVLHDTVSPSCPFCGILMQRFLPKFLLAPALV